MKITEHNIFNCNSNNLYFLKNNSIDLVITSPPYPMIEMWDDIFSNMNKEIAKKLSLNDGNGSFELMHQELDKIWVELERVTKPGGIICINIGDATRKIGNHFRVYMNEARIIDKMLKLNLDCLPRILWRKQTNSPNKFLGAGMLPTNSYVTLEHEHILIFRKKGNRIYKTEKSKQIRRESAFFWEERNIWFSDFWDFKGIKQKNVVKNSRDRTAAYPLELPLRLILMFSNYGDVVLDPFLGTGTTTIAAALSMRNSVGVEIDNSFLENFFFNFEKMIKKYSFYPENRISDHCNFIKEKNMSCKYYNENINSAVKTSQEKEIKFFRINNIQKNETTTNKNITINYNEV